MRIFLLILSFFIYSPLFAKWYEGKLELGSRFDSNPYYMNEEAEADFFYYAQPTLNFESGKNFFYIRSNNNMEYVKYSSSETADRADYASENFISLFANRSHNIHLLLDYELRNDPPVYKTAELTEITKLNYALEFNHKWNAKHSSKEYAGIQAEVFKDDVYEYLNSQKMKAGLEYSYAFLPQTMLDINLETTQNIYEKGLENLEEDSLASAYKYDSVLYLAKAAIRGQITEYSTINASFGYAVLNYEAGSSFAEPVFHVGFEEQISPNDVLSAGYEYMVDDSYFTNWELKQSIYLSYGNILSDQLLLLWRLNYIYKTYSNPNRREDQRFLASLRVEYSYAPSWNFILDLKSDILATDAYSLEDEIDPASSYQSFQLGLAMVKNF